MLTPMQRSEFETRGLTRLGSAVDAERVAKLCALVWKFVGEREGLYPTTRGSAARIKSATVNPLKRAGEFDLIYCPEVRAAADELLGSGQWLAMPPSLNLLMSLPGPEEWVVSHGTWHLDYPCPGGVECLPGVQPFLFLDRVEAHAGGTLAVAGSHRLVAQLQRDGGPDFAGRSREVRGLLGEKVPWLRALWSVRPGEDREARFMAEETSFEGVPLQVVEMAGEPGDVVLMHPWLLHALAPNSGDRARIVLTDRLQARAHPNSVHHRLLEARDRG